MTSTNEESTTSIIKSDTSGRPRYSREHRERVLAAYAASGMSGPAFAKHCGVKYPTFIGWVAAAKRRSNATPAESESPKFLLAEVAPAAAIKSGFVLSVALPGGASAAIDDISAVPLLAALVRELA